MRTWIAILTVVQLLAWCSQSFCGEIHDAAQNGDLDKVGALIKGQSDLVSSRNDSGQTALIKAAARGQTNLVAFLLTNKLDVSARDNAGQTALHWAAQSGERAVAILLLTNKAEINVRNNSGWTPLHYATAFRSGETNMVSWLIANGADVNAKDNAGKTPLHLAALYGFLDVAELLMSSKAEINSKDSSNQSPMAAAADTNSLPTYMLKTAAPGKKSVADLLRKHGGL